MLEMQPRFVGLEDLARCGLGDGARLAEERDAAADQRKACEPCEEASARHRPRDGRH